MTRSATSSTRSARGRSKAANNSIGLWIVGISAAVVLVVVLLLALNNRQSASAIEAPDVPAEWLNGTVMGNPDAPVTVSAWEDFLCPACGQWTAQIEPQLIEDYIKSGDVKLEFHFFPLSGHEPGASMAAQASLCASDQGAFWTYHNRLFAAQSQGQSGYTIDALTRYADELGLDSRALLQCMSSQQYREQTAASAAEAISLGLNATPSILVNGTRMANPFDYNELTALIEQELGAAGQ